MTLAKLSAAVFTAAGLAVAGYAGPAAAVTTPFVNIFPANAGEMAVDPYVGSFSAEITDLGGQTLKIAFNNNLASPAGSFIGDVYIDDDNFLSLDTLNFQNVGTVDFGTHNGSFPQGNKINFDSDFKFKFNRGAGNGVQNGESLGISFDYVGLFDDFIVALDAGDVRLGMHIQGLPNGASDSIVSGSPGVVPAPMGVVLLLSAFGVAAVGRRALRRTA